MNKKSLLKLTLIAIALFASSAAVRAESAFDEAPTPLRTQAPVYPETLRRDGVSGMVSINVTIDESGNVTNAVVAKSSNPAFEQAAVAAVSQWKFKPAKKAGQAVTVSVVLPVRFTAS
jgi:periplasmic protein TonB